MPPCHRWALALLLVALPASVRAQDPEIVLTPGLAHLELRFGNSNQAVIDYLTANPVRTRSWPPDELPVRLFNPGQGQPTARTDYVPGSVPPAASATAIARPDVSPAGSSFLIEVDHLVLGSGATYRFGTSNAIAPSAHICGPVSPQEAQPAGTTCPLSECAALLELHIILEDEGPDPAGHPDLAGLDRQAPVYCGAQVYVEEAAYSQVFVAQATSSATFDIDTLSGEGGVLPVLARADGSRLRVNVSCQARVKDGEVGFVLVPGTGRRTPLAPAPVFRTPACDALLRVDLPIEVERTAGVLKGLFDVNGRTETRTEVWFVHDGTWFTLAPPGSTRAHRARRGRRDTIWGRGRSWTAGDGPWSSRTGAASITRSMCLGAGRPISEAPS
jgi:hypothetical protein